MNQHLAACALGVSASLAVPAHADDQVALPAPLRVADTVRIAKAQRGEVVAARARAHAAAERPVIAAALDDPEVFASIDHLPLMGGGADVSLMIEQRFPLSGVRGHRRRAAEAEARRERALADRTCLDVELEAAAAFWMLAELRERATLLDDQRALAEQVVAAATARLSTGAGIQADILRAQIEVDRLDGERRAIAAELRAAAAMLDTALGRPPDAPIPELDVAITDADPPGAGAIASTAIANRPELRAGHAEVVRAEAEVSVMRSMYTPMAMVRTGPSYTMTEGTGWMVMVGVSIPLWRDKLRAGVNEVSAMADMAHADLEAMQRMIGGEATAARERVAAAHERYLALRDNIVPHARQAIAPALAAYAANQAPLVSTTEAAQTLWEAQRELAMARAELGLAWARLYRTTGEMP
ncbi:MAG TPA: TolC family protein [Kofleriaceae bacterium]|nr:TolC family protein [Kofleriaceae bacterium]